VTDFLAEKRKEIGRRLEELRPLVDEYHRLEAAEQALAGVAGGPPASPRKSRSPGSGSGNGRKRGGGRPKGSGTRGTQALELVRSRPGITIAELAEAMDIKQNYLYRVMPELAEQGLVVKSGRGWHVKQ